MLSTGTKVLFRNHFIVMRDSAWLAGVAFGNRISNLATSVHHRYSFVALMHVNIRRASSIGAPASLRALTHALEASRSSEDADVLVISVLGGGCSGFMYDLQIQSKPEEDGWQFISCDGITIAVHDKDSKQLSGITLDFVNSLMGGGFKVINPNAQKACSCGKSFR